MKKLAVVAVIALFAGGAAAQQQLPPGGQEFKDGDTAFKKKDWAAAITAFEGAVQANPTLYASHYFLGYAYKNTSDFTKSGDNFALFIEKVPNDPRSADMVVAATREAGISYARARGYEKAVPFLEKAVDGKPNDTEVLFFLGVAQMTTKDEAGAEQTFAKVIQLQPQFDRPYYFAGRINFKKAEYIPLIPDICKGVGRFQPWQVEYFIIFGSVIIVQRKVFNLDTVEKTTFDTPDIKS